MLESLHQRRKNSTRNSFDEFQELDGNFKDSKVIRNPQDPIWSISTNQLVNETKKGYP